MVTHRIIMNVIIAAAGGGIFSCHWNAPLDGTTFTGGSFRLTYPACALERFPIPFVVQKLDNAGSIDRRASGWFSLVQAGTSVRGYLKNGIGGTGAAPFTGGTIELRDDRGRLVDTLPIAGSGPTDTMILDQQAADTLALVRAGTLVMVPADVTLSAPQLTIEENVLFILGQRVTMVCEGELVCAASSRYPVFFTSDDPGAPWGGLVLTGTSRLTNVFFCRGGGNTSGEWVFGHSGSQAALHVAGTHAGLRSCFFMDNAGKGVTAISGGMTIDSCLFLYCDMGGEFSQSRVTLSDSWILFTPDTSSAAVDDDNDALYLQGIYGDVADSQYSTIKRCVFYRGKDDAIDHNGAFLRIADCWVEGFYHEGVAASEGNRVAIFNSYFTGCDQGIEAGYGNPVVVADHCLVTGNRTGVRFGDAYDWGCAGFLLVVNSIVNGNGIDARNFDVLTNGPVDSALQVSYSIVSTSPGTSGTGNCHETPLLGADLLLKKDAPGAGAAADGRDMGLVTPLY
ncbi:MAG: right-handed parallel beta-helix repeat-containing protein [Chitinispirillaceae bacterium]|nr:right-handed parallel beta-helix repeat-containing protein [Chitinispirillaceae bacterium]